MNLRQVANVLSATVIAIGAGQVLSTPLLFVRIEEPAAWFAAGGFSLIMVGCLTRVSIRYSGLVPGLHILGTVSAALAAAFWLALLFGLSYKFRRYPAAYAAAGIVVAHGVVAILLTLKPSSGKHDKPR
jgi:hypothetical protein